MDKNIKPDDISRKAAGRGFNGPHEEALQLGAFKKVFGDLGTRHELINRIQTIHRIIAELLQCVFYSPWCRRTVTILPEGSPPFLLIFSKKFKIRVSIRLGKTGDRIVSLLDI